MSDIVHPDITPVSPVVRRGDMLPVILDGIRTEVRVAGRQFGTNIPLVEVPGTETLFPVPGALFDFQH